RISTGGTFTEYKIPNVEQPYGIAAGPDGALWFTEPFADKIGRVTTLGNFTLFTIATADSESYCITAGPDGALWFTEYNANKIGRITTGGALTEYPIPSPGVRGPFGTTS